MPRKRINLPRFTIKDKHSKEPTLIYLVYSYKKGDKPLKYSTGHKVIPKYWTGKDAKITVKQMHHQELNERLYALKKIAESIAKDSPNISHAAFKNKLTSQLTGYSVVGVPDLVQYIDQHVQKYNVSVTWRKQYSGLKNKLLAFSEQTNTDLSLSNIDIQFRNDFLDWLYTTGVNSPNTSYKAIQRIGTLMKYSSKESIIIDGEVVKYHNCEDYLERSWHVQKTKPTKHYLEFDELQKVADLDLIGTGAVVRDYFLLSAYLGLRISDIKRFDRNNIFVDDDFSYVAMNAKKGTTRTNDTSVVIPVMPELQKLLDRFDFPKMISEQKMNNYLKDICKAAGLDRKVLIKVYNQGDISDAFVPLYSTVSNHTGRYTFINIMINHYDIGLLRVQKMTGQSLKVLQQYERGDKKKSAKKVLDSIMGR